MKPYLKICNRCKNNIKNVCIKCGIYIPNGKLNKNCEYYLEQILNKTEKMLKNRIEFLIHKSPEEMKEKIGDWKLIDVDEKWYLVVIQRDNEMDNEIEDVLSEIDLNIANDKSFEDIELDVIAVPDFFKDGIVDFLDYLRKSGKTYDFSHGSVT